MSGGNKDNIEEIVAQVRAALMPAVTEKIDAMGRRVEIIEQELSTYKKLNESVEMMEDKMNTSLDRI
jgi:molecular chaperone GrpE (heat shock protein)